MVGETFKFNATVPNDSIVTNLSDKRAVEVPVATAKLSLAEIKEMVDELFEVQAGLLPPFARPS